MSIPFLAFPAGLGGAIAMTERRRGVKERSGEYLLWKNCRESLGFEDKLIGEAKREENSLTLTLLLPSLELIFEKEELRWQQAEREEEAIVGEKG